MAKIYGLFGTMTGKVADVVMSVRNGQQVVRKYQPVVNDRKSEAQTAVRARLKLLSQLSAVFAPVITMPRQGVVSPRNRFVQVNYQYSKYSEGVADIDMSAVKITKSVVGMNNIFIGRGEDIINLSMATATIGLDVNRVVYVMFERTPNQELRYIGSAVATVAGADSAWRATAPLTNNEVYVYAYGVRDNTDAARVTFGNMTVLSAEQIAQLLVSRSLTETDVTVTDTAYNHLERASA